MARIGFVVMLSAKHPPKPRDEVRALEDEFLSSPKRKAHLLMSRAVDPDHYRRGASPVAIIEAGTHAVLALATFDGVLEYGASRSLGSPLYRENPPPMAKVWVRLTDFRLLDPPAPLESLDWTVKCTGAKLASSTLPKGQAAAYFQIEI
jgi:hypothetical protein